MTEWITTTVLILSFAMMIVNAFMLIYNLIVKAKEPTSKLDTRVDNLERLVDAKFKEYDTHFNNDLQRIQDLEMGTIVILESLQALLKHSIDGNDVDSLKQAEKALSDYLIRRGKRL